KQRVKKLERKNKLKVSGFRRLKKVGTSQRIESFADTIMDDVSKQGEIIANMDADEDVTLKVVDVVKEVKVEKDAKIEKNADDDKLEPVELKEVVEVVTTAKLMTEVVTATAATITVAATPITAATITTAPSAARRRKGVVIRDPKETAAPSIIIHTEPKSKDKGKGIMTKEQMEEEDSRALKRKTKSSEEKAVKKKKLDEEVEELKKHLQIVPNNDDDVYTEATPLTLKVAVVDYAIHTENNKPYFKIISADGTHQLFLSF
nr:hypothetical protein [Tanacetum cinerariifolium]